MPPRRRNCLCFAFVLTGAMMGSCASDPPLPRVAPGAFDGTLLVVSDADMAATAYADGALEPVGDADALSVVVDGAVVASASASNSVISWPQVVDASPDGVAFVVETKGPAPAGADQLDSVYRDFPEGRRLTALRVRGDTVTALGSVDVGTNPGSVEWSEALGGAVVATETPGAEVALVTLGPDGRPALAGTAALDADVREDDAEPRIRTLHVSPDGRTLAANVANRRVQFFSLERGADGIAARALGPASGDLGSRLATGAWTPDGRYFLITDTNWSDSGLRMLFQGPGAVTVLAPVAGAAPRVVSRAEVGRSPEGFAVAPSGRRVATINMERTYLPERAFLSNWAGRKRYSVSLLDLDPATGALAEVSRIEQAGILPEDVVFDRTERNLAVAVFHRREGEARRSGWIDFFRIEDDGSLTSQGVTQRVVRGAHDMVVLANEALGD